MKFRWLPERFTAFEVTKCLFLFVLVVLGALFCAEKFFIDSWQRRDVYPYIRYAIQYNISSNVIQSFAESPPVEFINIYHKYGDSKEGVAKLAAFHDGIFSEGFDFWGDDKKLFGEDDYFATAKEFLVTHSGDCDEHASLRYHILSSLGYKTSVLIGYGLDMKGGHAVTVVQIDGKDYVMDINYFTDILPFEEWMKKEKFILSYTMDKNGLHIYHGNLYSI